MFKLNDVFVTYGLDDLSFFLQQPYVLSIQILSFNYLDSYLLPTLMIQSLIHLAKGTLSQKLLKGIVLEIFLFLDSSIFG